METADCSMAGAVRPEAGKALLSNTRRPIPGIRGKIFRRVEFYADLFCRGMRISAVVPSSVLSRLTLNP